MDERPNEVEPAIRVEGQPPVPDYRLPDAQDLPPSPRDVLDGVVAIFMLIGCLAGCGFFVWLGMIEPPRGWGIQLFWIVCWVLPLLGAWAALRAVIYHFGSPQRENSGGTARDEYPIIY